jgi:hypothetical protein
MQTATETGRHEVEEAKPEARQSAISNPQSAMLTYTEQYHCPQCSGAIAPECVSGKLENALQNRIGPMRRVVRIYCDHCDVMYEASFSIVQGYLQPEGPPRLVTDGRVKESFMRRVGHFRGDVQAAS